MVSSSATTVEDYLADLPEDRLDAITEVREAILANLGDGYVESMSWGMITYEVPLEAFPDTYNGKPLMLAALASQKRHMAVYLPPIYCDEETESSFRKRYEATGKKLDMGKSCVRFSKIENLPVELIGEVIAENPLDTFLATYRDAKGL